MVKDVSYCFPDMQNLIHPLVTADICYFDSLQLLLTWLKESVIPFEEELKLLFNDKEIQKHFPKAAKINFLTKRKNC